MLNDTEIQELHRKYAPNDAVFNLVFTHCRIVCEIAEWCVTQNQLQVDGALLRNACLLHDIGTYVLFNEQGEVINHRMYPQHAIVGAKIVLDEGIDHRVADAIETHVLMGLTKLEIESTSRPWPLPSRDYEPQSIEGELLCYADRFHSKHPVFNQYQTFLANLERELPEQAKKFKQAAHRFGIPDITAMAEAYGHPVK